MKTSKFNLGNFHLTTCEMGRLVPIGFQEVLPGDIFSLKTSILARALPMLAPVMHPIHIRVHHFFVPNRILWRFWGDFITSSNRYPGLLSPKTALQNASKGTLADYFNLPLGITKNINAFPFLSYLKIWTEYFADDEINQDSIVTINDYLNEIYEQKTEVIPTLTLNGETLALPQFPVFPVSWRKDYFTSARNEPQLGDDINIPLTYNGVAGGAGSSGSVFAKGVSISDPSFDHDDNPGNDPFFPFSAYSFPGSAGGNWYSGATFNMGMPSRAGTASTSLTNDIIKGGFYVPKGKTPEERKANYDAAISEGLQGYPSGVSGITTEPVLTGILQFDGSYTQEVEKKLADTLNKYAQPVWMKFDKLTDSQGGDYVSNVVSGTSLSLTDLRNSLALQRIQEHRQMYGDRFVEYLSYLGVKSSDARLQRPQLLATGRELLQISEVLQTAEATGGVVGSMKGHGVSSLSSNRFLRGFEEHGFILSFVSIVPQALYTQGVSKVWDRSIPTDYWQKELNNLGMQPIKNSEVYFSDDNKNDEIFGYQNIWDEYRSNQGRVSGDFRDTLSDWHLARFFANRPALNSDFIACNPSKRIFAEQTTNPFLLMVRNRCVARRLLPKRSNPKTF